MGATTAEATGEVVVEGKRGVSSMDFCRPPVVDMVGFALLALTAYTVSLILRTRPSRVFFLE